MANANTIRYMNLLASSLARPFKITMETNYGLIVEFLPDASINAKLNDSIIISTEQAPVTIDEGYDETRPKYKYRMFPDWGTSHLFYDSSWPSNPQDALNAEDEDILRDHMGTTEETALRAWLEAYNGWASNYDEAFDKELNQRGDFDREVFPDLEVKKAWTLEGMMLAVWLALQRKVDSVEYNPNARKVVFSTRGHSEHSLNNAVGLFLAELDSYVK